MKKWILLLMMSICIISMALAEEETLQPARYAPGELVQLTLNLSSPKISGLQMRVQWDPTVLELAEEQTGLAAFFAEDAQMAMLCAEQEEGALTIVWMQEKDVALTDVCMLDLPLQVKEDARGGETQVSIPALMLMDAQSNSLHTQVEGILLDIDAPMATATPVPKDAETTEATAMPTATPMPQPMEAYVWLAIKPEEVSTEDGQYIPNRPGEANGMIVIEPMVTPVPTPATVVLGSTPEPAPTAQNLFLRVSEKEKVFLVELIATNVTIGGLQATINYDPAAARCLSASFAQDFKAAAMIQMVNCNEDGTIRLVYSSVDGHAASGEAIFAAEFAKEASNQIVLKLSNVKCTNMNEELTMWRMENQQTVYTIQPMDDLTIVQNAGEGVAVP